MAGFTLVELLVAMLIGGVAIAAQVALFRLHGQVARRTQAELTATAGAAWALSIVVRDLELAGVDPLRSGVVALSQAGSDRLVVDQDHNGDGAIDASSAERVTISWSAQNGGRLLRALGRQSMNIATEVPAAGFRVRYFDATGAELPVPVAGELDAASAAAVRRVALELVVIERWGASQSRVTLRGAAALRARSRGSA
jgi:prepilin-type N-terminal cleavage/methylation domain-containing protein